MKEVTIYTDGACSGNPGPGGWAVILNYKGHMKELSGGAASTTNQRMELTAAIEGLKALKEPCRVKLFSDSAYLVNAFNQGWLEKWKKNGWMTSKKKPVENQDLWQQLVGLVEVHEMEFIKVAGHSDNELNNRCDKLAKMAIPKEAA
ncbi:Ribonuclease H [Moorella thermoacetica]|uniref:Ribonuclease H n=1 Tax=Neomoorella thermoacetica TaxID=1525 RepID=A0AAC9HJ18_NEOTH|nr:ribonuclease HI [Moorella thermoacetica]AOQ24671.1 Ribonuclease H [Moorella thermoacetica]TYL12774.1 Ribonuclease H [Moorella thermoacetica]